MADPKNYLVISGLKRTKPSPEELFLASAGAWPLPHGTREAKLFNLIYYKPDVVVMGTSTVASYINVHHPALKQIGSTPLNLGLAGLTTEEMKKFFHHLITLSSPKKVIIALEFSMFAHASWDKDFPLLPVANEPAFTQNVFLHLSKNIFQVDYICNSLASLWDKFITPGLKQLIEQILPLKNSVAQLDASSAITGQNDCLFKQRMLDAESLMNYWLYQPKTARPPGFIQNKTKASMEDIKEIVALAKEHNIELSFYVSPNHVRSLEYIRLMGYWPYYKNWLRNLVQILDGIPLIDFMSYNSITLESMPACAPMTYFADTIHFKTFVGDMILYKISNMPSPDTVIPNDFGVTLTTHNVEKYLAALEEGHVDYKKQHGNDIKEMKKRVDDAERTSH